MVLSFIFQAKIDSFICLAYFQLILNPKPKHFLFKDYRRACFNSFNASSRRKWFWTGKFVKSAPINNFGFNQLESPKGKEATTTKMSPKERKKKKNKKNETSLKALNSPQLKCCSASSPVSCLISVLSVVWRTNKYSKAVTSKARLALRFIVQGRRWFWVREGAAQPCWSILSIQGAGRKASHAGFWSGLCIVNAPRQRFHPWQKKSKYLLRKNKLVCAVTEENGKLRQHVVVLLSG